jgi:cyclophilin family peptidyl-prolyl cis-trans isomerase
MYSNYSLQMTILNARGMVGWAGGGSGPDFFINTYLQPVEWWEHQHTVWGQIKDEESLQLVQRIYKLPATLKGMRMLDEKIEFRIELF